MTRQEQLQRIMELQTEHERRKHEAAVAQARHEHAHFMITLATKMAVDQITASLRALAWGMRHGL